MKRTAGSYLREAEVQLPAEEYYDYAEQAQWRLEQRAVEVRHNLETVPHGEERKATLGRELTHLLFEISYRLNERTEL